MTFRVVCAVVLGGCVFVAAAVPAAPLGDHIRPPLAGTLVVHGGFGDYRASHFHAGYDFGTGGKVGKPVRAPAAGWVERVRASGVGYGRSVYFRLGDGRTLQFGHLDAFAEPIASYVRHVQDSTGQYEQDLFPRERELSFRAGAIVAWTGQSGAGGPHLHFEVRRGDMAFHPARAGLTIPDKRPPAVPRLTLEPLDDRSAVAGGVAPVTFTLARPDTVRAIGRLRVVLDARDGEWGGVDRSVPWSAGVEWRGQRTECRFDSVSWATDMRDAAYVHDAARVIGEKGLVLWAPPGFRPRVLRSDRPLSEEVGTILIEPDDPPRTLRVWARDVAGHEVERSLILRPGPAPDVVVPAWSADAQPKAEVPGAWTSLPGGFLRWSIPVKGSEIELQLADQARKGTRSRNRSWVVFSIPRGRADRPVDASWAIRGDDAPGGAQSGAIRLALVSGRDACEIADPGGRARIRFPAGAVFEPSVVFAHRGAVESGAGLEPLGESWAVEPRDLPLRAAARVSMRLPDGESSDRIGLYRQSGVDWSWVGATYDSVTKTVSADTRDVGRFALFRDTKEPNASLLQPPRFKKGGAYIQWAVEVAAGDAGSGIDGRSSWLEIDDVRVPTEWDPEVARLRWRPAKAPSAGTHRVVVVVTDRAGNVRRETGTVRVRR